jgi:hypothetical protein
VHIVAPHGWAPQWGVNAVQFGGIDLPVAVLVLIGRNFSGIDRPQDRGLVPADRRSGCSDGLHRMLPTVLVGRYGATALDKETYPRSGTRSSAPAVLRRSGSASRDPQIGDLQCARQVSRETARRPRPAFGVNMAPGRRRATVPSANINVLVSSGLFKIEHWERTSDRSLAANSALNVTWST